MGFIKTSFADALRDVAFSSLGVHPEVGKAHYEELKKCDNFLTVKVGEHEHHMTLRTFLELLGTQGVRKYDEDFWARSVLKFIQSTSKNVCIDDLRYPNEYRVVKNYCKANNIDFQLIFCDYHSENYRDDNPHESAQLAKFLKNRGYEDQEIVDDYDIAEYELYLATEEQAA